METSEGFDIYVRVDMEVSKNHEIWTKGLQEEILEEPSAFSM